MDLEEQLKLGLVMVEYLLNVLALALVGQLVQFSSKLYLLVELQLFYLCFYFRVPLVFLKFQNLFLMMVIFVCIIFELILYLDFQMSQQLKLVQVFQNFSLEKQIYFSSLIEIYSQLNFYCCFVFYWISCYLLEPNVFYQH